MGASITLVMSGAGCLILTVLLLQLALPREGKTPSAWARTEMRAMGTAILVIVLLASGALLLVKAFL